VSTFADNVRQPLDQVRRAWQTSPLPGFIAWWLGELRMFLPSGMRAFFSRGACWYLIERQPQGWSLRRAGESVVLVDIDDALPDAMQAKALRDATASIDPADFHLALCLPVSMVLRRRLALPMAARDKLRQVAGYEMDRQTPFRIEQVHYGVREIAGPAPTGQFAAELAVLPRAELDPLLQRLGEVGIVIDAVDVVDGDGRLGLNLLPPERAPHRANRRRRLNLMLAAAALLLALAAMGSWLHNRATVLAKMQDEVAAMQTDAQRVGALRQRLSDSAGAAGFLAQRKASTVSVLTVLGELTRRLPDDTWLERFTVGGDGAIGFQGQSPQAARLVDVLKGAKTIDEPSFQGTIQADPVSGKERFYMVARVHTSKPEVAHAPQAR
jgi:general secretion pathway protein L